MNVRLSLRHPKANKRAHRTLDLPIGELPKRGDKLDLSKLIKEGLPSVKVISIFIGDTPEIKASIVNPGKFTATKCNEVFRGEDGWAVYGC